MLRLDAGEVAKIWLIHSIGSCTNLYHILFPKNHLSVCIKGIKNTWYFDPIISFFKVHLTGSNLQE